MQTSLPDLYRRTPKGRRAESILRSCVHCGFCNATCPTYQILGDELDGPRGRIYLIKDMLEQQQTNEVVVQHLDRCLTCRACETTCPSGVAYGELLEIGREFITIHHQRSAFQRLVRGWLNSVVPMPGRFARWARLGRSFRFVLPAWLRQQLPAAGRRKSPPIEFEESPTASVLLLDGCVQRVGTPDTNAALEVLLTSRRIAVVKVADESCCGGLSLHLGEHERALEAMRRNLDALAPFLDKVEAVISTASGCGVTLKDYERLLESDDAYGPVARELARKTRDVGEYLQVLGGSWNKRDDVQRVALHLPCTLQHGQKVDEPPRKLLAAAGYELVEVREPQLCCGSAGTYSLLQPVLAEQLRELKLDSLQEQRPDIIATANVGCQMHLSAGAGVPVVHWLELLVSR